MFYFYNRSVECKTPSKLVNRCRFLEYFAWELEVGLSLEESLEHFALTLKS